MQFLGYKRKDGRTGIRNYVLVLPVQRVLNSLAQKIAASVKGTKIMVTTGEIGRSSRDRQTIARVLEGVALNGNVGGVLILGDADLACKELNHLEIAAAVRESGKPVAVLTLSDHQGFYGSLAAGVKMARNLSLMVSRERRVPCAMGDLMLGVKCGMSDPTSGISGNPVVGKVFDMLVDAGGTAIFSETTEIIGAEHILAGRCATEDIRQRLLGAVDRVEKKALSTGEDIRKINPIPENIRAGISTLEEKSLGAIAKSGSKPIQGVLKYGERPSGKGLYFMDAWMSSLSLPIGNAAAGVNLFLYQMGGQGLPKESPPMPTFAAGVVAPIMYLTGNRNTCQKAEDNIDFCSADIMEGRKTIQQVSEEALKVIADIASGTFTKVETLHVFDPIDLYLEDPCF